eukprot:TRINITY_DN75195_c0_g1_i1.p1 TRINITY_DN75195_c0_g1~~TRINITY_DN75195_c0_g1_i1.p1  ORF type:complete len:119 (+),score=8.42 TRINITY_DN75195_c0_g1_i1:177-533(+)
MDDMVNMFVTQHGRCAYSGMELRTLRSQDCCTSLERRDNTKGYAKDNCCLICWELQTCDRSSLAAANSVLHGSPQWSVEKYSSLLSWLKEPLVTDWILSRCPTHKDVGNSHGGVCTQH